MSIPIALGRECTFARSRHKVMAQGDVSGRDV